MLKSKIKSILSLSIVLCLCLTTLSACGNNDNVGNITENNSTNDSVTSDSTSSDNVSSVPTISVGATLVFGTYEQDNDISNGTEDIEWIVLDYSDGKALVISKYSLDAKKYHEKHENVTWETCDLRKWLNNEFLNNTFSESEQNKIVLTTLEAVDNPKRNTDAGNETQDKIFLLSIDEAEHYFKSDEDRRCQPTPYAISKDLDMGSETSYWMLRTPGFLQTFVANVHTRGDINTNGHDVDYDDIAMRPAMWITVE